MESAQQHIMFSLYPALASGNSAVANTRVEPTQGSIAHEFGVANERTKLVARSTSDWSEVLGFGVGHAVSGHTAVVCELDNSFGPEVGGRPKIVIFGGLTASGYSSELLIFIPDDHTYTFFDAPNGTHGAPTGRADHSVILDANNVMHVFFGRTAGGVADDVWSIDLRTTRSAWMQPLKLDAEHAHIAREGHSSSLIGHDEALVFGGVDATGLELNDLWILNLRTFNWTEASAALRPAARRRHSASVLGGKREQNAFSNHRVFP